MCALVFFSCANTVSIDTRKVFGANFLLGGHSSPSALDPSRIARKLSVSSCL